jgi:hypothetical protein
LTLSGLWLLALAGLEQVAANVPPCTHCVDDYGAVGDGAADDTEAFRKAVAAADTVLLPMGTYRLTDTVVLRPKTRLVGEHAILTRVSVQPNTPAFMDPAHPRPVLDTPDDAEAEVHLRQLSISAVGPGGGHGGNTGAIGLRWRAGRRSSIAWANVNAYTSLAPFLAAGHRVGGPYRGYKCNISEGGHRVPLVVRWPSVVKPATRCDQLVCLSDLMATCAETLRVKLPDNAAEGSVSLLPLLRGLLEKYVSEGRSTPGVPQKNDVDISLPRPVPASGASRE